MNYSRRQLLQRSALGTIFAIFPPSLIAKERPNLTILPLIDIGRGRPVRLDIHPAHTEFDKGKNTTVWGANGQYLAPTVRVKSGSFVKLTYTNSLPDSLSLHIQGLLAPTEMVGSIHRQLPPKSSWSPIITVQQPACTCWYHADTMLKSAQQIYRGVVGLWIIDDEKNKQAKLPSKYGIDDIPLILQDQLITKTGEQAIASKNTPFLGKRLFVNGKENPQAILPRGWIRLRLVNASLSRRYHLQLDNDKPLYLIATGMGMLSEPAEMQSISLAPSERIEVLIDLNGTETVSLIDGRKRSMLHRVGQFFHEGDDLIDNVVLSMKPEGLPSAFSQEPSLPPFDLNDFQLKIVQERKFHLRPSDALINQQRFDPERIDVQVKLNSVERWYLTTTDDVGFTLQGAKFIIETRNRKKLPHKLLAWQDTVWLNKNEETTLLVKFSHTADQQQPFTFGVTDRIWRDRGTMGQFTVT